jgi:hypothetical protein
MNGDIEYLNGLLLDNDKTGTNNSSPNVFAANYNTNHNKS